MQRRLSNAKPDCEEKRDPDKRSHTTEEKENELDLDTQLEKWTFANCWAAYAAEKNVIVSVVLVEFQLGRIEVFFGRRVHRHAIISRIYCRVTALSESEACECPHCVNEIDFTIDDFLLDEIRNGNVVIFAGAGISTENPNSAPHSLYTEMAVECGLENPDLAFPDLTQMYSDRPDGRFKLLQLIQNRFDYVSKFADLRHQATRFYDELSTMPYLRTYITTNWDRYFEERCHAKPFVYDADMRFWNIPFRKVLKIHGTIDDYSSLVATRGDYDECSGHLKTSLIGGKLKEILNNQTCIFIGYSMQDDDFREIFEFVRSSQGAFVKTHYVVSPTVKQEELPANLRVIGTDGTYFLNTIKQHLCSCDGYIPDEIFDILEEELWEVQDTHNALWEAYSVKTHPQMLLSAMYQDGLIHGYQMARDLKRSGQYSSPWILSSKMQAYQSKILDYSKKRDYIEAAYFEGYQNVLIAILASNDLGHFPCPPHYFYTKPGALDRDQFEEMFEQLPNVHKAAFKQCQKAASKLPEDGSMVLDHSAWG